MSFSLNEIEATAKKAARGAGYPWGLAEEAARATRWLCSQGLPGAETLAALLEQGLAADLPRHSPRLPGWNAAAVLCPLITGAALSDSAATLARGPLVLPPVARPLLLLPFVAAAAARAGQPLAMIAADFIARTDGRALETEGSIGPGPLDIALRRDAPPGQPRPRHTRATPDPAAWGTLTRFAHRTYAPASEASRLKGAGAGLSDND